DVDDDLKMELSELLSYQVAGAEHSVAYKSGSWSGRSTLFSYEKATFPAGFVSLVASYLKQKGHRVQLIRKPAPEPQGLDRPHIDDFGWAEEYDYQLETVERLIKHR